MDGAVRAFCVKTENTDLSVRQLGTNLPTIRVSVEPAKGEKIRSIGFKLWASSLQDVAQASKDDSLQELSARVPDWSMVPLMADYGLSIGYIRCEMVKITAVDQIAKGLAMNAGAVASSDNRN